MADCAHQPGDNLVTCALKVLNQADPCLKAHYTEIICELWNADQIPLPAPGGPPTAVPDRPARPDKVRLVSPAELPRRGKGGSLASRQALLHSLVHIECCAIDLAWDIIARFGGGNPDYPIPAVLPREFFADFLKVAEDEARHFSLLLKRLNETGMDYGDIPAHDGLWESAMETAHSLPARLAVEHATHEARGLDVLPQTIGRFRNGGDAASAELLEGVIYPEEIGHCAAGVRWLRHLHAAAHAWSETGPVGTGEAGVLRPEWVRDALEHATVEAWFHALVRRHFHGPLKPPFNEAARAKAGFGPEWYLPLATKAGAAAAEGT